MICPICGGSKAIKCLECQGHGHRFSLWPSRSKTEVCPRCEGEKEITCPVCNGEGRLDGDLLLAGTASPRRRESELPSRDRRAMVCIK